MAKRKRVMKRDWDERIVTLRGVEYKYNDLNAEMKDMCGFLGLGTKLQDVTADMAAYNDKEKIEKVNRTFKTMLDGLWRVPGTGKQTMKKKMDEAKEKATPEELEVLKKLGLV